MSITFISNRMSLPLADESSCTFLNLNTPRILSLSLDIAGNKSGNFNSTVLRSYPYLYCNPRPIAPPVLSLFSIIAGNVGLVE